MELFYQDARVAVCLKPPGVLSTDEPGGMPELLREALGTACVRTVHRLDRVVGGVMVFARSRMAASLLSAQVRERKFQKEYLAVVHGAPQPEGQLRDVLLRSPDGVTHVVGADTPGGKEALLSYRVLEQREGRALVAIALRTGRTHQIRCQFAAHGHPLLSDRKYGHGEPGNIALWSSRVGFFHPEHGGWMEFSCGPAGGHFEEFSDCISAMFSTVSRQDQTAKEIELWQTL